MPIHPFMSGARSWTRHPSTRRLFAVYAAVSLVPVLLLGVLLSVLSQRQADRTGLRQGANEALLVARSGIAPLLAGHDLRGGLDPTEVARVTNSVTLSIRDKQVLRLRLRDLSGRVVYADDNAGLGTIDDEAVEAADGDAVTHLTRLNTDRGDSGTRGPRVVEAYVPLVSAQGGTRIGVLEVYLPYAPIQSNVAAGQRMLTATLGAGLFLLWLALLGVSLSVTRTLRRQATDNAFLARHDPLTSLPNRASFAEHATAAIEAATEERQVALALIDLDRFKEVNDTLGHGNGDQLLIALADRLVANLRDGDLVARLGGDEFGVIVSGVHGPSEAVEILSRLRTTLAAPINLGALPLAVEASVGFALAPADGADVDTLLSRADLAMYTAKSSHHGVLHYQAEHDRYDAANLTLVAELSHAIQHDQLVLHYQPKTDLRGGAVTAVEALVRWQHPVKGLLYPDAFLPAAEQTELVEPLTRWVLATAISALDSLDPDGSLAVAVNISARSLARTDFADDVLAIIAAGRADPRRIILENRDGAARRPGPRRPHARDAFGAGVSDQHRRLRRRTDQPRLPGAAADLRAEDRQGLRPRDDDRRAKCGDRPIRHRARAQPGDDGHGRRSRNRGGSRRPRGR